MSLTSQNTENLEHAAAPWRRKCLQQMRQLRKLAKIEKIVK